MSRGTSVKVIDARKLLTERVAASRYVNRSARLRDLLLYVTDRVLEDEGCEIHEHEVGHRVFGRPPDYDTVTDNIVRVHASLLRKRLEQYFSSEGAGEPVIIEIPKGNYAPVFREREEPETRLIPPMVPDRPVDWRLWCLAALAAVFAGSTAFLLLRGPSRKDDGRPTVRLLWAQVLRSDRPTDIVLDDAGVGLYQELTGRQLTLSDYFDRDYLRSLPESAAAAKLDESAASAMVLRRQSSFANTAFLWKLLQVPGGDARHQVLRFARDYSFRDLKANNAVLLGTSRSNPWVESFEPKLGLRWVFDKTGGVYYPVDKWTPDKNYGDSHEGYFSAALLPNLGGTGNILIVSGTGGSAMSGGADFLADEQSVAELRNRLHPEKPDAFPYFEALIKVKGRSASARDATLLVCRTPK